MQNLHQIRFQCQLNDNFYQTVLARVVGLKTLIRFSKIAVTVEYVSTFVKNSFHFHSFDENSKHIQANNYNG